MRVFYQHQDTLKASSIKASSDLASETGFETSYREKHLQTNFFKLIFPLIVKIHINLILIDWNAISLLKDR